MCAHYRKTGDVAVRNTVCGFFFHFGENVAHNLGVAVRSWFRIGHLD